MHTKSLKNVLIYVVTSVLIISLMLTYLILCPNSSVKAVGASDINQSKTLARYDGSRIIRGDGHVVLDLSGDNGTKYFTDLTQRVICDTASTLRTVCVKDGGYLRSDTWGKAIYDLQNKVKTHDLGSGVVLDLSDGKTFEWYRDEYVSHIHDALCSACTPLTFNVFCYDISGVNTISNIDTNKLGVKSSGCVSLIASNFDMPNAVKGSDTYGFRFNRDFMKITFLAGDSGLYTQIDRHDGACKPFSYVAKDMSTVKVSPKSVVENYIDFGRVACNTVSDKSSISLLPDVVYNLKTGELLKVTGVSSAKTLGTITKLYNSSDILVKQVNGYVRPCALVKKFNEVIGATYTGRTLELKDFAKCHSSASGYLIDIDKSTLKYNVAVNTKSLTANDVVQFIKYANTLKDKAKRNNILYELQTKTSSGVYKEALRLQGYVRMNTGVYAQDIQYEESEIIKKSCYIFILIIVALIVTLLVLVVRHNKRFGTMV